MSASVLTTPDMHVGPFVPPIPQTMEETGLTESCLQQLILKILYYRAEAVGRDLGKQLGLNFSIIESTLEYFKLQHLVVVKSHPNQME